jgi:hypothetical protein
MQKVAPSHIRRPDLKVVHFNKVTEFVGQRISCLWDVGIMFKPFTYVALTLRQLKYVEWNFTLWKWTDVFTKRPCFENEWKKMRNWIKTRLRQVTVIQAKRSTLYVRRFSGVLFRFFWMKKRERKILIEFYGVEAKLAFTQTCYTLTACSRPLNL